jgi:hypothetical protein
LVSSPPDVVIACAVRGRRDPDAVAVIRFGVRVEDAFRAEVMKAIGNLQHRPKLVQMRCDFDRFVLTEDVI